MVDLCLCTNFPNFKTKGFSKSIIKIMNVLKEAHTRNIKCELLIEINKIILH